MGRTVVVVALVVASTAIATGTAQALPGAPTVEESSFVVESGKRASGIATCPAGKRVVGGGVGAVAEERHLTVAQSGPVDETGQFANTVNGDVARSWFAMVRNHNVNPDPQTIRVFALCSMISDAVVEVTHLTGGQDNQIGTAMCPAGRRAVGGGAGELTHQEAWSIRLSGPVDETGLAANTVDNDVARGWHADVQVSNGFGENMRYAAYALCSTSSTATVQETTVQQPEQTVSEIQVSCPLARRVTGGGLGLASGQLDYGALAHHLSQTGPLGASGTFGGTNDGNEARQWGTTFFHLTTGAYRVFVICTVNV
ncbi:hypothetical protein [Pseudonocardia sp. TRM90224]|uniref:hypothetical protein n=1 Tax=Pseudonocardia sp. TRM90224 TaxID=2812678 RepID=UPI001E2B057E|nr:hypothetical protein [Pseudonocardia sp. TRM90224]